MKTKWYFLMALAIVLSAASCSNEKEVIEPDEDGQEIRLDFIHPATRVTDTNFEIQDRVGVYMVAAGTDLQFGGNELNNELFSYNGTDWTSERKCYWNEGSHDVYAYYPYKKGIADTQNYAFTVQANQNNVTADGMNAYEASDFLQASALDAEASANPVKLKFNHCLSKIKVVLVKGEDYKGDIPDNCEVFIHNLIPTGLVNLQNGGVEVSPYAGVRSIQCRKISTTEFIACVIPQRIASRRPLVEVCTSNVSYMLEGVISLKQGYQSTITVTLSQSPDQVAIEIGGSMGDWE